jgi:HEAT repeat protein
MILLRHERKMNESPNIHNSPAKHTSRIPGFAALAVVAAIGLAIIVVSTRHSNSPVVNSDKSRQPTTPSTPPNALTPQAEPPLVVTSQAAEEKNSALAAEDKHETGPSVDELARILKDAAQPVKVRIKAARALIANGSNQAIAAIKEVLWNGPAELRAAIGESLGGCSNPESYSLMLTLLADKDQTVAMGAVRGLARQGSREAMDVLHQTLYGSTMPLNVRCEAALGLGSMNQPGIAELLAHAAAAITDEAIVTQVLNALASRPIGESKDLIENFLKSPGVSPDFKVAAIEALGDAKGDPSSFLMSFAQNPDANIRAAAAWALSNADGLGPVGEQLLTWLQSETDPTVRLRLYQALGNQQNFNVPMIEELIRNESNPSTRTAGFDLMAKLARDNPSAELTTYFDRTAVPELQSTALTAASSSDRMAAVIALKRAGTPAALSTLQILAQQATDSRVRDSARGGFSGKPATGSQGHH